MVKKRKTCPPIKNRIEVLREIANGVPVSHVALKYHVSRNTIYQTVKRYNDGEITADDLSPNLIVQASLPKPPIVPRGPGGSGSSKRYDDLVARLQIVREKSRVDLETHIARETEALNEAIKSIKHLDEIAAQVCDEHTRTKTLVDCIRLRIRDAERQLEAFSDA